jgi:hypothetical protein
LAKKRAENDLQRQKAMLPDTQKDAENVLYKERMKAKEVEVTEKIRDLMEQIRLLKEERYVYQNAQWTGKPPEERKETFIGKCPATDCKGYLSTRYKCKMCETKYCPDCMEQLNEADEEDHVCKEDTKQSLALIKKETKPCPGCGVRTYKMYGCDQMWCPECKEFWSYDKCVILHNPRFRHNPVYLDWARNHRTGNNRLANEGGAANACESNITWNDISNAEYNFKGFSGLNLKTEFGWIWAIFRIKNHIEDVTERTYKTNFDDEKRKLRVKFLLNRISEDKWQKDLRKITNQISRNREILLVTAMMKTVIRDFMKNFIEISKITTYEEYTSKRDAWVSEIQKFREYNNNVFSKIGKLYGLSAPYFTRGFRDEITTSQVVSYTKKGWTQYL